MKLLTASYVLPIAGEAVPAGAVAIDEGRIADVGKKDLLQKKYPAADVEEYPSTCLLPGLVNAETRLELLSFDGTEKNQNFVDWLIARIDFGQRAAPDLRRSNIREGIKKLLSSGTTCIGDVGRYTGALPEFSQTSLRATLFPEMFSSNHPSTAENYQSVFSMLEEILAKKSARIAAGIAPFSPYALSRPLLKIIAQQAETHQIPLRIRAAESFAEMQFFQESTGEIREKLFPKLGWSDADLPVHRKTPIEFLESIDLLRSGPLLSGCLHLAGGDYKILAKNSCKIVWSPRAQKYLNLGDAPIKKLIRAKIPIALGADGTGSRHSLSLWDEMREGLRLSPPEELLQMATLGGATGLGRDREIGSLEKGKKADLISIRIPSSLRAPRLASHLVEKTTEHDLLAVWIDGQKINP